jgi:hypothetical protein
LIEDTLHIVISVSTSSNVLRSHRYRTFRVGAKILYYCNTNGSADGRMSGLKKKEVQETDPVTLIVTGGEL